MSCKHRFYDELDIQSNDLEYLFIGTFNPEWDAKNGNNAVYFYGRETNQFWCILPHAFNENCLIDKTRIEWEEFCRNHKIGITDLIKNVSNAEEINEQHYLDLTINFYDEKLEKYTLDFNTETIMDIINHNKHSLKGVYFTRKTGSNIYKIWENWRKIKSHCIMCDIKSIAELPSPSTSNRKTGIRSKIKAYNEMIKIN